MWRRIFLVVVLLSCAAKRHPDNKPSWKVSTSEINDERNAIAHGKHLGDVLRAPHVLVDAHVTINDSVVAERYDLRFQDKQGVCKVSSIGPAG